MQLTVNIKYEQLIDLIKHLPVNQLARIKSDLDLTLAKSKVDIDKSDFQEFLLNGPIMTDDQYSAFKKNRKAFNQWRSE